VRLEGLGKLKKSNDLIGTRSHDLPACSIVPQPTTLQRAPIYIYIYIYLYIYNMQYEYYIYIYTYVCGKCNTSV
jgi:hypothetical protein